MKQQFPIASIVKDNGLFLKGAEFFVTSFNKHRNEYRVMMLDQKGNLKNEAVPSLDAQEIEGWTLTEKKHKPAWNEYIEGQFSISEVLRYHMPQWKVVRPIHYRLRPGNDGLAKIMKYFTSKNELRWFTDAVHFDRFGVTATDAERLIHIDGEVPPKLHGTYDKAGERLDTNRTDKDQAYPDYIRAVPRENEFIYPVSLPLLYNWCLFLMGSGLLNGTTHYAKFAYRNDGLAIGFNVRHLRDVVHGLMLLEHSEWYIQMNHPGRPAIFTTHPKNISPTDDTYGMVMPVVRNDESTHVEWVGNSERASVTAYFDFSKDGVMAGGKFIDFETLVSKVSQPVSESPKRKYANGDIVYDKETGKKTYSE
jgi:hypothetical protein